MTIFYNAFHAPIGAHSSFTAGCRGRNGGLGLELGGPADENLYIGMEAPEGGRFEALPFFEGAESESARYDHTNEGTSAEGLIKPFRPEAICRDFRLGEDKWKAGDLTFSIYSPVEAVPDPVGCSADQLKAVVRPSVLAELTLDNRQGKTARKAFFGFMPTGNPDALHVVDLDRGGVGICKGQSTGIFSDDATVHARQHFTAEDALREETAANYRFGLGGTALLVGTVPAGQTRTFRFAVCFFRGGIVTTGMPTSYLYSRFFNSLAEVAAYSLKNFEDIRRRAEQSDRLLGAAHLNDDQRFQMIHAIRSYYGSTQLLEHEGKPLWVVNEGEYRMLNTFDLTVDQLFFEMRMNPWTVRNELDLFTSRYSYRDTVHFPGGGNDHPGGISFCHDMGVRNHFTAPGFSSYELSALTGCFSHMTHEQLVNWVLCAAVYARQSRDKAWLADNLPVFEDCLQSMLNRDNPVAAERNGIMALDSSRTADGAEITTYDSLDTSLGQARHNVYMAVKGWAAYLAMERIFAEANQCELARVAGGQADRAAATIVSFMTDEGYIPAVMGEACDSRIIPAIEGLVFPYVLDQKEALDPNGRFGQLIQALSRHLTTILVPGVCLYPDGGWQLSSTADNSWLSKIYLCQFVARRVLGIRTPATGQMADAAHRRWLLQEENLRFAWSDQMRSGVAHGSKYYPRGVTSILWLEEEPDHTP